uniref:Uncharacterized protein n=1 Tax=viral metagenome TaxID=1070528 RepID=A0A6M3LWI4_9ZZZZ
MKLNPIFNLEKSDRHREVMPRLSDAAQYARELYQGGFKMTLALREASQLYHADIHTIASELGFRGGKSQRRRMK